MLHSILRLRLQLHSTQIARVRCSHGPVQPSLSSITCSEDSPKSQWRNFRFMVYYWSHFSEKPETICCKQIYIYPYPHLLLLDYVRPNFSPVIQFFSHLCLEASPLDLLRNLYSVSLLFVWISQLTAHKILLFQFPSICIFLLLTIPFSYATKLLEILFPCSLSSWTNENCSWRTVLIYQI